MEEQGQVRLRLIATVMFALAIFSVGQAVYFSAQDNQQQDCFAGKIDDIVDNLQTRSKLATKDSALTAESQALDRGLWLIYADAAGLLKDDPTSELSPEEQEKLQIALVEGLVNYQEKTQDIAAQREQLAEQRASTPIPDFPTGECTD